VKENQQEDILLKTKNMSKLEMVLIAQRV